MTTNPQTSFTNEVFHRPPKPMEFSNLFYSIWRGKWHMILVTVLSLGWTLNYEIFFYALCAISLALHRSLIPAALMLITLSVLGWNISFYSPAMIFWTNPIVIEFIFGILLAKAYLMGWCIQRRVVAAAVFVFGLLLLLALAQIQLPRFIAAGFPAAIIVCAGTLFYPNIQTSFEIFGDASFALYLSHRFVLRVVTLAILPLLPANSLGIVTYTIVAVPIAIGFSILVHFWLEKPLVTFANKATRL
jgi:exopolysaccharide production protein ExoZ